jgi:hypothetical protein
MFSDFRKSITYREVPRLCPFVGLVRATYRKRLVLSVNGIQLPAEYCSPPQISHKFAWDRTWTFAVKDRELNA